MVSIGAPMHVDVGAARIISAIVNNTDMSTAEQILAFASPFCHKRVYEVSKFLSQNCMQTVHLTYSLCCTEAALIRICETRHVKSATLHKGFTCHGLFPDYSVVTLCDLMNRYLPQTCISSCVSCTPPPTVTFIRAMCGDAWKK
jgi:hypothetical protein